jgi:hypothetical protein
MLRYASHFSWCAQSGLMLLLFLLGIFYFKFIFIGAVFGIAGLVLTDGSGVLKYFFSEQNLTVDKVIFTGDIAKVLNVCFNGILFFYY